MAVQFSRSVVSYSLWHHEAQNSRPPCPSPTPGVHPNSCPLSQWCHPTISSSVVPFSSCLWSFSALRVFSSESAFHIRWPKYGSFSFRISPCNEYSGLISFRIDWLDLLAVQGVTKSRTRLSDWTELIPNPVSPNVNILYITTYSTIFINQKSGN